MDIAFPDIPYTETMTEAKIETLEQRWINLCRKFFQNISYPGHKLIKTICCLTKRHMWNYVILENSKHQKSKLKEQSIHLCFMYLAELDNMD